MKLKKTLTSIVLAGAITFGGCSKGILEDSRYDFNDKLGNEQIEFKTDHRGVKEYSSWAWNYLKVEREDGRNIKYVDKKNNLQVDKIMIGDEIYRNNAVGEEAIKIAQEQFENYLTKIIEYKQQKSIDAIK